MCCVVVFWGCGLVACIGLCTVLYLACWASGWYSERSALVTVAIAFSICSAATGDLYSFFQYLLGIKQANAITVFQGTLDKRMGEGARMLVSHRERQEEKRTDTHAIPVATTTKHTRKHTRPHPHQTHQSNQNTHKPKIQKLPLESTRNQRPIITTKNGQDTERSAQTGTQRRAHTEEDRVYENTGGQGNRLTRTRQKKEKKSYNKTEFKNNVGF